MRVLASILVVSFVVLVIACSGAGNNKSGNAPTTGGVAAPAKAANEGGLELLDDTVQGKKTQFGGMEITGTVVNHGKKLRYAQITFNVYDDSGAQVGSALANVNGLESGGRWNFKAVAFAKGKSYKFSELTGF